MAKSEMAEAILDAAERRVRQAGYNGFSFRDLAEDVGIKSASVHYHFSTKEALGARLAERYTARFLAALDEVAPGAARLAATRSAFRESFLADGQMCLCGMLGAERGGLPDSVARETRRFFQGLTDRLAEGQPGSEAERRGRALQVLAQLEGALVLARAYGDIGVFDLATESLVASGEAA